MIAKPKAIGEEACVAPSTRVYVALGSNLGDREANVKSAAAKLGEMAIGQVRLSSLYRTAPEEMDDAPDFVNAVAGFDTTLSARALLDALQGIEIAMGRPARHGVNESRCIDLDIVAYGECCIDEPGLIIPHPRAAQRAFVLVPLAEIAPDLQLPGQPTTVSGLANGFAGDERITVVSSGITT